MLNKKPIAILIVMTVGVVLILLAGVMYANNAAHAPLDNTDEVLPSIDPAVSLIPGSPPEVPVEQEDGNQIYPPANESVPAITSAELVDYGNDKDTYKRGDTAISYVVIRNTGNTVINDINLKVTVSRLFISKSMDYSVTDQNIKPGESKRIEFATQIPENYNGMSTAGDYKITCVVTIGGSEIGSFEMSLKVV